MSRKSAKLLRSQLDRAKVTSERTGDIVTHDQTRYATQTVISLGSTSVSASALPASTTLPLRSESITNPHAMKSEQGGSNSGEGLGESSTVKDEDQKRTQTSQTLNEFLDVKDRMLNYMFSHSYDKDVGQPCECDTEGASKTTRCYDCSSYPISCTHCYVKAHQLLPYHWAEVWVSELGYFQRHDIATLQDGIASINLGHQGKPCPSKHASNVNFILVASNGVHSTKIRFCQCKGAERWEQLMENRLFPSTVAQPTSAFTFGVLHQYHLQHLASKASAHDFAASLRMLTDNVYHFRVPDMAPQLRMVMRIWRLLVVKRCKLA